MKNKIILFIVLVGSCAILSASNSNQLTIKIENNKEGAPITIGIPFPKGALYSIDNVRLLNSKGQEIASQITEVTTWQPADDSVKWIWVFFFSSNFKSFSGASVNSVKSFFENS